MKKFKVTYQQAVTYTVEIEAKDVEEAEELVERGEIGDAEPEALDPSCSHGDPVRLVTRIEDA